MAIEFEVSGVQYKASKIPGMTQLHVMKAIAPAVGYLAPLFGKDEKDLKAEDISSFANALESLPTEAMNFIIDTCMRLCERENGHGGWARIWDATSRQPMFDDISGIDIIKIVGSVAKGSYGNFSQGLR